MSTILDEIVSGFTKQTISPSGASVANQIIDLSVTDYHYSEILKRLKAYTDRIMRRTHVLDETGMDECMDALYALRSSLVSRFPDFDKCELSDRIKKTAQAVSRCGIEISERNFFMLILLGYKDIISQTNFARDIGNVPGAISSCMKCGKSKVSIDIDRIKQIWDKTKHKFNPIILKDMNSMSLSGVTVANHICTEIRDMIVESVQRKISEKSKNSRVI